MKERKSRSPKVSSGFAERELDKAAEQFDAFEKNVKDLTLDRMNAAPKEETEQQTKISNREAQNSKDIYLKPKKSIFPSVNPKTGEKEKFNEKFRDDYNFAKEYVQFIAENKEIGGESITIWTRPFGGLPAEEWEVPVNKPVWGPRHLADQIKRKSYHRLVMQEDGRGGDHTGKYYGTMIADSIIQRLDAHPVATRKSIFMGASGF